MRILADPAICAGGATRADDGPRSGPSSGLVINGTSETRGVVVPVFASWLTSRRRQILREMNALHAEALARGHRGAVFVTLTFAARRENVDPDGAIRRYRDALMRWCERNWGFRPLFYWVAEPQGDGTIHYHMVVWVPRRHWRWHIPKPDASQWSHGSSEVAWVRKSAIGYMAKYLAKYGTKPKCRSAGADGSPSGRMPSAEGHEGHESTRANGSAGHAGHAGVVVSEREARTVYLAWLRFRGFYPGTRTHAFGGVCGRVRAALGRFRLPRYIRVLSARFQGRASRRKGGGWIVPGVPGCDWIAPAYVVEGCLGGFLYVKPSGLWASTEGGGLEPLPSAFRVDGCPF